MPIPSLQIVTAQNKSEGLAPSDIIDSLIHDFNHKQKSHDKDDDISDDETGIDRWEIDNDCVVLSSVLYDHECESLVTATNEYGYTFWHPDSVSDDTDNNENSAVREKTLSSDFSKEMDNTTSTTTTFKPRSYRSADTIELNSQPLAELLWTRIEKCLRSTSLLSLLLAESNKDDTNSQEYNCEDGCNNSGLYERGMEGYWRAIGINPDMLFVKYSQGGHFSPVRIDKND